MSDLHHDAAAKRSTFRSIDNRPIYWTDGKAITHICEGSECHHGVRLLWTLCQRDVPANSAFLPGDDDKVTCPKCLAATRIES